MAGLSLYGTPECADNCINLYRDVGIACDAFQRDQYLHHVLHLPAALYEHTFATDLFQVLSYFK